MRRIDHLGLIAVGGAGGALVRWGVAEAWVVDSFPWPTLCVNVIGCALLGLVTADGVPLHLQRLLAVGFCGGLTTFSTFSLELVQLHEGGELPTAIGYLVASVALGLVAFAIARSLRIGNESSVSR